MDNEMHYSGLGATPVKGAHYRLKPLVHFEIFYCLLFVIDFQGSLPKGVQNRFWTPIGFGLTTYFSTILHLVPS